MTNEKVYAMPLSAVYDALRCKLLRKGRTEAELSAAIEWLTGWTADQTRDLIARGASYGDFFRTAPAMNPRRNLVTGAVCGIRVEQIEEPLMRDIRILDKLVDELAKGKPLEKVLRSEKP